MAEDNNLFTYALLGVAAYFVYNYFTTSQATAPPALSPGVQPAGTQIAPSPFAQTTMPASVGTAQASPSASISWPVPTAAQLDAAATAAGYTSPHSFNLYQWNYFYTMATGQSTSALNTFAGDPNALMTSAQYVSLFPSYLSQNGLGRVGVVHTSALRRGAGVYGWS